jgi:hypothetical protein
MAEQNRITADKKDIGTWSYQRLLPIKSSHIPCMMVGGCNCFPSEMIKESLFL